LEIDMSRRRGGRGVLRGRRLGGGLGGRQPRHRRLVRRGRLWNRVIDALWHLDLHGHPSR
jgi:hypothetical protein